ncbi:MAG: nucleotidyltransferase domain-containing protein [Ignavibacteria bacterium]|nr:nucleotidyltransferase domain-containing protein [Ignavibacteria bacterium]
MDKEQIIVLVKKYSDVVRNYFNVSRVVLFGSYASGLTKEWSDIDVAVFLKEKPVDLIAAESILFKLRRNIDSRIEPIIIYDINDPSGFPLEILDKGITIYQTN